MYEGPSKGLSSGEVPAREGPSISSSELIVFLMDGSGSMTETSTYDARMKIDHLCDIVKAVTERLNKSGHRQIFRISHIYFSEEVFLEESGQAVYFPTDVALNCLKKATDVAGAVKTSIAGALEKAREVIDRYVADPGIPAKKDVTVFLFTDGQETVGTKPDVQKEARKLTTRTNPPVSLATISFGLDADENLLKEIASRPKDIQLKALELSGALSQLVDTTKLYIQGHAEGDLTEKKAEAIRNFVETLSKTRLGLKGTI